MRALSFLLITLFLIACTSHNHSDCQEADWFELGRRDGATGKLPRFQNGDIPLLCTNSNKEEQKKLFHIGRNVGLVQFCRPENAFELGKEAKEYDNVCPEDSQMAFLDYYRRGLRVREIQIVNQDIDSKLTSLAQRVKALSSKDKNEMESQILKLKDLKSQNEKLVENIQDSLNL